MQIIVWNVCAKGKVEWAETISKQLSKWMHAGSLEVGKLKLLCQRLFKVPAARQALFLKAGGENPMPDNIGEDDSRDLMFFSIEVGNAASSAVSWAAMLVLCLL